MKAHPSAHAPLECPEIMTGGNKMLEEYSGWCDVYRSKSVGIASMWKRKITEKLGC